MNMQEIQIQINKDPGRCHVIVREVAEGFTTDWDGNTVIAGNPFGLDSALTDIGCPQPRNLYLLDEED